MLLTLVGFLFSLFTCNSTSSDFDLVIFDLENFFSVLGHFVTFESFDLALVRTCLTGLSAYVCNMSYMVKLHVTFVPCIFTVLGVRS